VPISFLGCLLLAADGDDSASLAIIVFPWFMHSYYVILTVYFPSYRNSNHTLKNSSHNPITT